MKKESYLIKSNFCRELTNSKKLANTSWNYQYKYLTNKRRKGYIKMYTKESGEWVLIKSVIFKPGTQKNRFN
jgi:hypothetical protein